MLFIAFLHLTIIVNDKYLEVDEGMKDQGALVPLEVPAYIT